MRFYTEEVTVGTFCPGWYIHDYSINLVYVCPVSLEFLLDMIMAFIVLDYNLK